MAYLWLIILLVLIIVILEISAYRRQVLLNQDLLTKLHNRRWAIDRINRMLRSGKPCAVAFMDIDDFKDINDFVGHMNGDRLLTGIAERIGEIERGKWILCRIGGDEFVGIFEKTASTEAERICRKILSSFEEPFMLNGSRVSLTASIGIARSPEDTGNGDDIFSCADIAMYAAKKNGKNKLQIFSGELRERLERKKTVSMLLSDAIEENGFSIVFQPFFCAGTGSLCGAEALLRMKNSLSFPDEFIPVAEENRSIVQIGRIVAELVIRQIAEWNSRNMPRIVITMNFSNVQLQDTFYPEYLGFLLKKYNVPVSELQLEMTESVYLNRVDETRNFLRRLSDLGVQIVLDDFGTGYSSISYLNYVNFRSVKLDKSLMDRFLQTGEDGMLDGIVNMIHSLNMKVIAEGVEKEEQADALTYIGCDYIQGFLYAKPMTSREMETLMQNENREKCAVS